MRVLETVDRHGQGVATGQLARELGLTQEMLAPMLAMLKAAAILVRPTGCSWLGNAAILLGSGGRTRRELMADKVKSALAQMRDEVDAAVYFGRYIDGEVRIIDYADGPTTPRSTSGSTSGSPRTPARSASAC